MLCIKVHLHAIQPHNGLTQGVGVCALRAEALGIAPHQTLVGSRGQLVNMTETSLPWPLRSNSVVHSLPPHKPQASTTYSSLKMCLPT